MPLTKSCSYLDYHLCCIQRKLRRWEVAFWVKQKTKPLNVYLWKPSADFLFLLKYLYAWFIWAKIPFHTLPIYLKKRDLGLKTTARLCLFLRNRYWNTALLLRYFLTVKWERPFSCSDIYLTWVLAFQTEGINRAGHLMNCFIFLKIEEKDNTFLSIGQNPADYTAEENWPNVKGMGEKWDFLKLIGATGLFISIGRGGGWLAVSVFSSPQTFRYFFHSWDHT